MARVAPQKIPQIKNCVLGDGKADGLTFRKGLTSFKADFFRPGSFSVGNVFQTRFQEDTWLVDTPLCI